MNLRLMKKLCMLPQNKLRKILIKFLYSKGYENVIHKDSFIIAEGDLPICLIAHMDTVFRYEPEEFFYDLQKKVLWAPGGAGFDDRAGIYAILNLIEKGHKPSVIFTDKEETGGIGARELIVTFPECPFKDCRALIQLDRANKNDAVYYHCNNSAFENWVEKYGFKFDWGTFSDISIIAPQWKIAAVNLSVGYVDEHTESERLYCGWCDNTINKVDKMLNDSKKMMSYAYIPGMTNRMVSRYNKINCLICNTELEKGQGFYIPHKDFPYHICDKCYYEYYLQDEMK